MKGCNEYVKLWMDYGSSDLTKKKKKAEGDGERCDGCRRTVVGMDAAQGTLKKNAVLRYGNLGVLGPKPYIIAPP